MLKIFILACRKTGFETVRALLRDGRHSIVGVVSKDYPDLVNDGIRCGDFAKVLRPRGIPFWNREKIHDRAFVDAVRCLSPDVGLSIGWRRLVREPLISIPKRGFVNFHTSDLPKYRGFASTSWAILNGDDRIAITAHRMMAGRADEGDLLLKKIVPIEKNADIGDLFDNVVTVLPGMVLEFLDKLRANRIRAVPQNPDRAVLSLPRFPHDGWIDWTRPAVEIDRLVRAVARPYPGAFTCWKMKKLIVWKGRVLYDATRIVGIPGHVVASGEGGDGSIHVLTGKGVYAVDLVQWEGEKRPSAPATVIKGCRQRLGFSPGELFELLRRRTGDKRKRR